MTKQSNRLCTKSENGGSAHPRGITDALIDCHQAQQKQLVQMSKNVSINRTECKVLKQDTKGRPGTTKGCLEATRALEVQSSNNKDQLSSTCHSKSGTVRSKYSWNGRK